MPNSTNTSSSAPGMTRREMLTLVLLLGTQFMLSVDFSVFNVALPSIGRSVGISLSHVQWVITAFALPTAGFTLLFGRVADMVGRRRIFCGGLCLLIAASLVGGLANSPPILLGARVLQGLATAATIPSAFVLLVASFPECPLRQRALGLSGSLIAGGSIAGAVLGGVLTSALSWRWAFLFNVPVATLIVLCAPRIIAESRGTPGRRLDVAGAFAVTTSLLALVYGIVTAGNDHWRSAVGWVLIAAGAVLMAAFLAIEKRSKNPLVPLPVLRRPAVGWGNLGGFAALAMQSALTFVLGVYLQRVLHYSALDAGLILAVPFAFAFTSGILAPRTMKRTGSRALLAGGLGIQGLANLALMFVGRDGAALPLLLALSCVSFFAHLHAVVAFTVTTTSELPDDQQGLATSLLTQTQQTAITLGVPLIGTIATAVAAGHIGQLTRHIHIAVAVDGAVALIAALIVGAALTSPRLIPRLRPASGTTARVDPGAAAPSPRP